MTVTYMTGYNGTTRTRKELLAWSGWQAMVDEIAKRALWLIDYSYIMGRPLGIGSAVRYEEAQEREALSRHYQVATGGCCSYKGKRYQLHKGLAHLAFPGASFHEPDFGPAGNECVAIDWIGDMKFLAEHCAKVHLKEFSLVNREPWHTQPMEWPNSRKAWVAAGSPGLDIITLPKLPGQIVNPINIVVPIPTLRYGSTNAVGQTRALQLTCNFWGWKDSMGRTLIVDDDFGIKTAQAVVAMQTDLNKIAPTDRDGVYGKQTASRLQAFVNAMAARQ